MDHPESTHGVEAAFTDRPLPPWELPGNFRRDYEPHRAGLLRLLAALTVGAGALCLLVSTAELVADLWPLHSTALLSLPAVAAAGVTALGALVWALARKDLALMRLGLMDPRGESGTQRTQWQAALGALLAAASSLVTTLLVAWPGPLWTAMGACGLFALAAGVAAWRLRNQTGEAQREAKLLALVAGVVAGGQVRRHPRRPRGRILAAWGIGLPLLGLLLLPRAAVICEGAAQEQTVSRLQKLTRAMLAYADEHNSRLPPAVLRGRDGRPLHSWRVLLLPYLGHKGLYQQFNLDEPWDSPHNLALLPHMPEDYAPPFCVSPAVQVEPGTTFYQVFVGEGTAFEGTQGLRIPADFPDGTSNTILIVEAGEAVPWTRPVDLAYARDRPVPALGGVFRGQGGFRLCRPHRFRMFLVGLADGSVRLVTPEIEERTLREAIGRNDGIAIGDDW